MCWDRSSILRRSPCSSAATARRRKPSRHSSVARRARWRRSCCRRRRAIRTRAQLRWLLPVARIALALAFVVTSLLSLGLYPAESSHALLARTGLSGLPADLALYGGALIDIALGLSLLAPPWIRRPAAIAPIGLILGYTAIITLALPELWRHPFGPVLKNLPILVLLWMLHELDRP